MIIGQYWVVGFRDSAWQLNFHHLAIYLHFYSEIVSHKQATQHLVYTSKILEQDK